MAQRHEWLFEYTGKQLLGAASAKVKHHRTRLGWWEAQKQQVAKDARENGLEVIDSIANAGGYANNGITTANVQGGARIQVKGEYQQKLDECERKIREHRTLVAAYDGWIQVCEANPKSRLNLDHEDWLFFFGRVGTSE